MNLQQEINKRNGNRNTIISGPIRPLLDADTEDGYAAVFLVLNASSSEHRNTRQATLIARFATSRGGRSYGAVEI